MNILDYVAYTDLSPSGLIWTKPVNQGISTGRPAGYLDPKNKSWRVRIKSKGYLAHRLIWELHYGPIPNGMEIDHIDRNPNNNKLNNLRLANRSENNRNKTKMKNNTSGYKGVSWHKCRNKWVARIRLHGRNYFLGHFTSPLEAHAAYCAKAEELHKQFKCTM